MSKSPETESILRDLRGGAKLNDLLDRALIYSDQGRVKRLLALGASYPPPLVPSSPCELRVYDCREEADRELIELYRKVQNKQEAYFLLRMIYDTPCETENDKVQFYFLSVSQTADGEPILCGAANVIWYQDHRLYAVDSLATQTLKNRAMTKGIGRQIMEGVIEHAKENGEVEWIGLDSVKGAIGFYERLGFKEREGYLPNYRWYRVKE